MGVLILAGTRKGLFRLRGDEGRRNWDLDGPHLTGWEVFHAGPDVYVDGVDVRDHGGLEAQAGESEIRVVAAVAGG